MRFVSPLLKQVVYPSLATTGYFRKRASRGELSVVTYHGVLPRGYESTDPALDGSLVTAESLRRQLRLLKSSYDVVAAPDVLHWLEGSQKLPARAVLLTCDDGLQNTLTDMLPVLREEGLTCLFFVTGASAEDSPQTLWYEELYLLLRAAPAGDMILPALPAPIRLGAPVTRRPLWWRMVQELSKHDRAVRDETLAFLRRQDGLSPDWQSANSTEPIRRRNFLLTLTQLRELASAGMFIGAHTLSHPVLTQASPEHAWIEIADSRTKVEAALGQPVWALAYPFGDPASVGAREIQMAERAGYKCAFLNCGGGFPATLPPFAIPRVHVTADMTLGEFEAHLSGFHESLRSTLRRSSAPTMVQ